MKNLKPDLFCNCLSEIPVKELFIKGYEGIIIDLDNTLTEWNSSFCEPHIKQWLTDVKKIGFNICIVSNSVKKRVEEVAILLNIPYVSKAIKPRKSAFYKAIQIMKTKNENTIVIGDQIFTDILGGNRAGLYTILVNPISKKEFIGTKIFRLMEYIIIRSQNTK